VETPAPALVTGIAATPDGKGYWVVQSDGTVSHFGDAVFYGDILTTGAVPTVPIVGVTATPTGKGYWLLGADGGVFTYGDAAFDGSVPAQLSVAGVTPKSPLVAVGLTLTH
jgi:hypothetical protein